MQQIAEVGFYVSCLCPACRTVSFQAHVAQRHERYSDIYETETSDEQFDGSIARLRLRSMVGLASWMVPPPRLRTSDRVLLREILRRHGTRVRVLDVGCGSGRLLQVLNRRGVEVLGVEVSESLVADLNRAGIPAIASGGDLPIAASDFDPRVVLMAEVLEHLENPLGLLSEIRQRCPSADVMVSVPSPGRRAARLAKHEPWDWPPNHLTRFSVEGLKRLLSTAGFQPDVILPAATSRDAVPTWWRVLPGKVTGALRRPRGPSRGPTMNPADRSTRKFRRVAGLVILWSAWLHEGAGRLLGWGAQRASRYSADSMLGVGIASTGTGRTHGGGADTVSKPGVSADKPNRRSRGAR